jgi:hypothetical protein
MPLDPRFTGSYPAKDDMSLRAMKIRSTTSFGIEVKPSVPCRKILQHAKDSYSMKEILVCKMHGHFSPSFSCFPTRCLCSLLPENSGGWIRNDHNSDGEVH